MVKFIAIVNPSDILGKFFYVKLFILENVILQMPLSVVYQTRAYFLWSTRYRTENKHLLVVYAVVNQITLRPKEIIHMSVT